MNILITICARGGSKGVPKKNMAVLAGKPLIEYTFEQAVKSSLIRCYHSFLRFPYFLFWYMFSGTTFRVQKSSCSLQVTPLKSCLSKPLL